MPPPSTDQRKNRTANLLWIALGLILLGDLGAYYLQTGGGKVQVVGFKLPTENGQWITADLFRPTTATEENPVPMVVVCPGFERSKETMSSYSIELARRGIAVIAIDPYNQGASSSTQQRRSASLEGYGVVPMVEYICDTPSFNYVDKSRIGAAGYSAGGNAVLQSASHFGARQGKVSKHGQNKADTKISSVFVGGYVATLTDQVLATVNANVGIDYAYFDEGAYRTEQGNAHLRNSPEALRLVNSILADDKKVSEVELDRSYGDFTNRTVRVVHNTKCIHPLMPYDPAHVANVVNFFTCAFGLDPSIAATDQVWWIKECCTLMSLAGALLFIVPFATLLLQLPVFHSLAGPIPPALPPPVGSARLWFWARFAFFACAACFLFIPLARATTVLFPDASASRQTWWFPERINNAILLWAVANGLIGLVMFLLQGRLRLRNSKNTNQIPGLTTNIRELGKTFCLALLLFAAFYGLLFASYGLFHTDFRFTFISAAATFPPKMVLVMLEYFPLFFVFYFANSLRVNCASRFEGEKEWLNMLINALGNSVGLLMILAIQYIHLAVSGTVFWTQEWLYTNLLLGVTPMMFVLPCFHRHFFKITGKVYLGPMVTCLIFIMMMLTSNVCYIPLK